VPAARAFPLGDPLAPPLRPRPSRPRDGVAQPAPAALRDPLLFCSHDVPVSAAWTLGQLRPSPACRAGQLVAKPQPSAEAMSHPFSRFCAGLSEGSRPSFAVPMCRRRSHPHRACPGAHGPLSQSPGMDPGAGVPSLGPESRVPGVSALAHAGIPRRFVLRRPCLRAMSEGHPPGLETVCEPGPSRARPATARSGAVSTARTVAPASTATLPWGMEHERRSRSDRVCLGSNLGTKRARSGVAAARTPGTEGARASRPRPRSQGQDVGPGWACHGCPVRGAGRGPRGDSQATASREAGGAPSSWQALQAPGAGGGGGGGRGVSRR